MRGDRASIQVYEETAGLGPGEPVYTTGEALSVELAPGLIEAIYDGIQRPLDEIKDRVGDRIERGIELPGIDHERKWHFQPRVAPGDSVEPGDILGVVQETTVVEHRIMVPHGVRGTVRDIKEGEFTVVDVVATVETSDGVKDITMLTRWPVRRGRPYAEKLPPYAPLVTGQRIIDMFFPVAKGGAACEMCIRDRIYVGIGMKLYYNIRQGNLKEAIFDQGLWYPFLTGFLLLLGGSALGNPAMSLSLIHI